MDKLKPSKMKLNKDIDLTPIAKDDNLGNAICAVASSICVYDGVITISEYSLLASFANSLGQSFQSASLASYLTLYHLDRKTNFSDAVSHLKKQASELDKTDRIAILSALDPLINIQHVNKTTILNKLNDALTLDVSSIDVTSDKKKSLSSRFLTALGNVTNKDSIEEFALVYGQSLLLDSLKDGKSNDIKKVLAESKRDVINEIKSYMSFVSNETSGSIGLVVTITDAFVEQMDLRMQAVANRLNRDKQSVEKNVSDFVESSVDRILLSLHEEMDFSEWDKKEFWNNTGESKATAIVDKKVDELRAKMHHVIEGWNSDIQQFEKEVLVLQRGVIDSFNQSGAGSLVDSLSIGIQAKIMVNNVSTGVLGVGALSIVGTIGLVAAGVIKGGALVALVTSPPGQILLAAVSVAAVWKMVTDPSSWKRSQLSSVRNSLLKKLTKRIDPLIKEHYLQLDEIGEQFKAAMDKAIAPIILEKQLIERIQKYQNELIPKFMDKAIKQVQILEYK